MQIREITPVPSRTGKTRIILIEEEFGLSFAQYLEELENPLEYDEIFSYLY